jgi:hypothetical protein
MPSCTPHRALIEPPYPARPSSQSRTSVPEGKEYATGKRYVKPEAFSGFGAPRLAGRRPPAVLLLVAGPKCHYNLGFRVCAVGCMNPIEQVNVYLEPQGLGRGRD